MYDSERINQGRNPRGTITRVTYGDDAEIHVRYRGKTVEWDYHATVDFAGQTVARLCCVRLDGILHCGSIAVDNPEWLLPGGDQQSYSLDHFDIHGEYDSSDGGEGVWQLKED